MKDEAISLFREYLQIETVQPEPDSQKAHEFLERQAHVLGLHHRIITVNHEPKREVVLMTWPGSNPSLPSILLNSHIDVVPVFPEHWTHPPFSAHIDEQGHIYARGSQDMKCVSIQYLQAIKKMKSEGKQMLRTIHLSFVPDEEIGSALGMEKFVLMKEFQDLEIGFALDEGLANPSDAFTVFYGERSPWWVKIHCKGKPGHGSRFIEDNPGEKIRKIINSFLNFRDQEEERFLSNDNLKLGDVTTVNLTGLYGGVQVNVVPTELIAEFDLMLAPTVDKPEFEKLLRKWCKDAGEDSVELEFTQQSMGTNLTNINDNNIWWKTFERTCHSMEMELQTEIFSAATDARFVRSLGIPALGFSPMNNTPVLLHDHNEYLNKTIFLDGILIYHQIIQALANIAP